MKENYPYRNITPKVVADVLIVAQVASSIVAQVAPPPFFRPFPLWSSVLSFVVCTVSYLMAVVLVAPLNGHPNSFARAQTYTHTHTRTHIHTHTHTRTLVTLTAKHIQTHFTLVTLPVTHWQAYLRLLVRCTWCFNQEPDVLIGNLRESDVLTGNLVSWPGTLPTQSLAPTRT
jgi:hypothetical protein